MIQMEADVIVVAAGASGLAATVAAAEKGMQVLTFEKNQTTGGAASMGMGLLGIGTRQQRMMGYNFTPEEIFLKHMHYTHWKGDARLVMEYYKKSASTIEWLEDMGVKFIYNAIALYTPIRMKSYAQPEQTGHMVAPPVGGRIGPRCASAMTKALTDRALELGAEIHLSTPVTSLIMEDGHVAGVRAKNAEGEEIEAYADAVILACGGYGDNPKMIQENLGYEWGKDLFSFRIPGNVGDGLRLAWEAGGAKTSSMMELMYQIPDNLNHFDLEGAFRQPVLWVNKLGQRFMPEDCIANTATTGNCIAAQPGHTCFTIMDADTLEHYKSYGVDFPGVQGEDVFTRFDQAAEAAKKEGYSAYFEADSIEDLCAKTGIDEAGLKETLEEYNACCDKGRDTVFDKDPYFLRPVRTPRFYAIQSFPGAYGTLGGVKIDYKTRVLNENGRPIPGLYSVGTDSCNIFGDTYPFVIPGNTMGYSVNTGRMGGENAAAYVESLG